MVNMSSSNNSTPRSTSRQYSPTGINTSPGARSTIDEFREIVREQSFVLPNNSSSEQVPVKRYPPLPDITVPNNPFFRTEATLTTPKSTQPKKQMFYHFAPTQRAHLPALNKRNNLPTMSNVMDLDEDLPQCHTTIAHRAATYTSPGDRVISPIKRPSAPSPPASAHLKRPGQNTYAYGDDDDENYSELEENDDDDDSQSFDEQTYRYNQQPVTIMNRRIDHYSQDNRFIDMNHTHHNERSHPLNAISFEP
ncbi:hypothetical protein I4U23_019827 [Adineta vaga]|nr:hypothetical protein I4U23_019827 [Adineta vaga]